MENSRNQKDSDQYRDPAAAAGMRGAFGAIFIGLAAALVFVVMALVLMVVGYSYGALLDVSPEYPFILSLPFMLSTLVAVVVFPIVAILASHAELGPVRMRTAIAAGAGFGAASMVIIWVVTSGPDTDPFDWPELLYLLQLTLSGITAGMILFASLVYQGRSVKGVPGAGIDLTKRPGRGGRVALVTALICMSAMSVPFLLMWQARRGFGEEARRQASEYFRLPAGFSLSIAPESSGFDSLEKNVRYRAAGVHDQDGRTFSVDVIGERSDYDFDIREITASLWAPAMDIPAGAAWDDSGEGRRTQETVLDLAGAYTSSPLEIVSVQQSGSSGKSIMMRGVGLEIVARPGGSSAGTTGVHLSFTARAR